MRRRGLALLSISLLAAALPWSVGAAEAGVVTIHTDDFGVPHVVAESHEAASYGTGYLVARDRLFQTDVLRRLGSGRLSEILGAGSNDANLKADMAMRQEFYDAADIERQYQALRPEMQQLLEAFATGFNVALAEQLADPTKKSAVVTALGYEPEPWRPQDSLIVLALFTIVTFAGEGAGGELESLLLLRDLVAQHGEATGRALWNDRMMRTDPSAPAVVPHGEGPAPAFVSASEPDPAQLALAGLPGIAAAAKAEADLMSDVRKVIDQLPFPKIGSYAMAATGERTSSGKGMLLGAPQAGFFAPSVFYELGIHAPGWDCTGFTVPGLGPFMGIGWCNDHAWTLVAGNAGDQVDMVVEKLCADGEGYLYDGECTPFGRRVEHYISKTTLPAPAAPRVDEQTVLTTRHGPVFRVDEAAGYAYVFRRAQSGHFSKTFESTYALNVAKSFAEIEAGTRHITATYNFVYADKAGNIAYRFTGYQPVRAATIDHRLPTPGWDSGFEWQARSLPYESMPHVTNPSTEFLVVNQGVDSKPISWWPRSSSVSISRFGHTYSDQLRFSAEQGMTLERVKELNRILISDEDGQMRIVENLLDEALAGVTDPDLVEVKSLYEDWKASGYRRTRDGSKLAEPAVALVGVDGLTGFPRSPVWDRFMNAIWAPAGGQPRAGVVGRIGWTIAAVRETSMFSRDYSTGWQQKLRDSILGALPDIRARWGCTALADCRANAPTVRFDAIGLLTPARMNVVDHGTYSQIVDLGEARGVNILPPGNGRADRALDIAGDAMGSPLPDDMTDQIALYEAFEFKPMKMRAEEYTAGAVSTTILPYVSTW